MGQTSLSVILKIFLTFERFEPGDSYKLDSYIKKCVPWKSGKSLGNVYLHGLN